MEGMFIIGTIIGRTRRYTEKNEEKKEIVTYDVRVNGRDYYVSHFSPKDYYPVSSEIIQIPIYPRAYINKSGQAKVNYVIADEDFNLKGEAF